MIKAILTDGKEVFKQKNFSNYEEYRIARYYSIQETGGNVIWEVSNDQMTKKDLQALTDRATRAENALHTLLTEPKSIIWFKGTYYNFGLFQPERADGGKVIIFYKGYGVGVEYVSAVYGEQRRKWESGIIPQGPEANEFKALAFQVYEEARKRFKLI